MLMMLGTGQVQWRKDGSKQKIIALYASVNKKRKGANGECAKDSMS